MHTAIVRDRLWRNVASAISRVKWHECAFLLSDPGRGCHHGLRAASARSSSARVAPVAEEPNGRPGPSPLPQRPTPIIAPSQARRDATRSRPWSASNTPSPRSATGRPTFGAAGTGACPGSSIRLPPSRTDSGKVCRHLVVLLTTGKRTAQDGGHRLPSGERPLAARGLSARSAASSPSSMAYRLLARSIWTHWSFCVGCAPTTGGEGIERPCWSRCRAQGLQGAT